MKEEITERQAQIIEATGKLLMQKGIKGLTTKNLAQEIGFTEGALYRHFKSKEDIIALLLSYFANSIQERLSKIMEENESAEIQLQQVFNSQFVYLQQNPHCVIAILSEGLFNETERMNTAISHVFDVKMKFLNQIIEKGKKEQKITSQLETNEVIHLLAGSFRLMILKWRFANFKFDLIAEGNKIMQSSIDLLTHKS